MGGREMRKGGSGGPIGPTEQASARLLPKGRGNRRLARGCEKRLPAGGAAAATLLQAGDSGEGLAERAGARLLPRRGEKEIDGRSAERF